jgi:hypothetical protein
VTQVSLNLPNNSQDVAIPFEEDTTFQSLLDKIWSHLEPESSVITHVLCDNVSITEKIETYFSSNINNYFSIRILAQDKQDFIENKYSLLVQTIHQIKDSLNKLLGLAAKQAYAEYHQAFIELIDAIEALALVSKDIKHGLFHKGHSFIPAEINPIPLEGKLRPILLDLLVAKEKNDFVHVNDLLRYELLPTILTYLQNLEQFKK